MSALAIPVCVNCYRNIAIAPCIICESCLQAFSAVKELCCACRAAYATADSSCCAKCAVEMDDRNQCSLCMQFHDGADEFFCDSCGAEVAE